MTARQEILLKIGQNYSNLLIKLLAGVNELHEETLISSASRLSGTFMFRAASLNTENRAPGQVVSFAGVDVKAAQLTNLISGTVEDKAPSSNVRARGAQVIR